MSSINEGTFQGYVASTQDALLIFEAVRRGIMPKITRRLREDERKLIKSGTVFVFDERESGIKRWTDGLLWSPSRILLNFLVYRQIDRKSVKPAPDQPAFATSQPGFPLPSAPLESTLSAPSQTSGMRPTGLSHSGSLEEAGIVGPLALVPYGSCSTGSSSIAANSTAFYQESSNGLGVSYPSQGSSHGQSAAGMVGAAAGSPALVRRDSDFERSLVGSLTSSYPFLKDGLCKKTISIQVEGSTQHLISYYSVEDVRSGRLRTPSSLPEIAALCISPIFLNKSNFRNPPHIEVGPDGIPRYRGDAAETTASRIHGHLSGSEGTSSGSDSRDAKSLGSSGSGMVLYSPSPSTDAAQFDPYYRYPHQIGGSGSLAASTAGPTNAYSSGSNHRRSMDAQLRRSASRYEPYAASSHYGYSATGSPYFSPSNTSYFASPGHSGSTGMSRKNSNASTTARGWTVPDQSLALSPGQAISASHAFGQSTSTLSVAQGSNASPYDASSDSLYPVPSHDSSGQAGQQQQQHQAVATSSNYAMRLPQFYQSDAASSSLVPNAKNDSMPTSNVGNPGYSLNRSFRASWDSGQPHLPSESHVQQQETQPPPSTSQGLTALSLYSQSGFGGSRCVNEETQPSPPPTSSSYSSHHSFASHAHVPAPISSNAQTAETSFGSVRNHSESLAHALDDSRKPAGNLASNYHMPPPAAPSTRWQSAHNPLGNNHPNGATLLHSLTEDRAASNSVVPAGSALAFHAESASRPQHAFWPQEGEGDDSAVKREDPWEANNGGAASTRARSDVQDASCVASSEVQQRRSHLLSSAAEGREDGLERVVLTKPSM